MFLTSPVGRIAGTMTLEMSTRANCTISLVTMEIAGRTRDGVAGFGTMLARIGGARMAAKDRKEF